jgi:hypothetical protein
MVGIIRDRAGQLGEIREYLMERNVSGMIWYSELQGGSFRLCRLRPASIVSEWTNIWNVLTYTGHMESLNWVAWCATEMEAILPYLMGVQWDSPWATHGVSDEAYTWKTCTRVRWALIVSLTASWIVVTRGALRACVLCCQIYTLAKLIIDSNLHDTLRHRWWL